MPAFFCYERLATLLLLEELQLSGDIFVVSIKDFWNIEYCLNEKMPFRILYLIIICGLTTIHLIIGAGIAGLSAGCYLQMNGYNTEIFEASNYNHSCFFGFMSFSPI